MEAQQQNDVTRAQEILQDAYRTDVRPLIREARLRAGGALDPVGLFREVEGRAALVRERGARSKASGL
jgi:L-rhamnose isomerase/sugar isomerase